MVRIPARYVQLCAKEICRPHFTHLWVEVREWPEPLAKASNLSTLPPPPLLRNVLGTRACTALLGETKLAMHTNLLRILCVIVFRNCLSEITTGLSAASAAALPASLSAMLLAAHCAAGMPARTEFSSDLWLFIHQSLMLPLPSGSLEALAAKMECQRMPLNFVSLFGGLLNVL